FISLFTAPPPTVLYTLSLHDALPICEFKRLAFQRFNNPVEQITDTEVMKGADGLDNFEAHRVKLKGIVHALVVIGLVRCQNNGLDRKSTRLNSSHVKISYAVFCLKKK